eukprot:361512-Chlamydomonas_euryale.AAC.2
MGCAGPCSACHAPSSHSHDLQCRAVRLAGTRHCSQRGHAWHRTGRHALSHSASPLNITPTMRGTPCHAGHTLSCGTRPAMKKPPSMPRAPPPASTSLSPLLPQP